MSFPESILGTEHGDMENLSQELGMKMTFVEPLNIEAAQQQGRTAAKRSAKAADCESGSNIVPR